MKAEVHAVVVVYNTRIARSVALQYLEHYGQAFRGSVVVCDNSSVPSDNAEACARKGFRYVDMGGNAGLSKAYNAAICRIPEGWVLLLDQDTQIDQRFLEAVSAATLRPQGALLLAPVVRDACGILSPCRLKGARATRIKSVMDVRSDTSFINSGSCIHRSVFEHIAYDEEYFMDFVDHDFVRRFKDVFGISRIRLLPVSINQTFSGTDYTDAERDLRRFAIFTRDFLRYCRKSGQSLLESATVLALRALKLTLKYRVSGFLRILFAAGRGGT